MGNRDNSYFFQVSNITESEAVKLSSACRRVKNRYARNGRGTSFSGKTCNLGNHLASYNNRKELGDK